MGLSFELACNESIVLQTAFGYQDYSRLRKASPNTIYRIASVSKITIAISILKLIQDNQIQLNDDVNKILPF